MICKKQVNAIVYFKNLSSPSIVKAIYDLTPQAWKVLKYFQIYVKVLYARFYNWPDDVSDQPHWVLDQLGDTLPGVGQDVYENDDGL